MAGNPFRKGRPEDRVLALESLDVSPAATPPPPVSFRSPAPPPPPAESPLPPSIVTDGKRRKSDVVKKVRVVSPPPRSPEDEDKPFWPVPAVTATEQVQGQVQVQSQNLAVDGQPQTGRVEDGGFPSMEELELDPFAAVKARKRREAEGEQREQHQQQQQPPEDAQHSQAPVPLNPFQKTLSDMEEKKKDEELHHLEEEEGAALKAGNLAKGSLDVGAFQRLLMTGRSDGTSSPLPTKSQIVSDLAGEVSSSSASSSPYNGSLENLSVIPGQPPKGSSGLANEVAQSGEDDDEHGKKEEKSVFDPSDSLQAGTGKKAPPPPTSRHGKTITVEKKATETGTLHETPQTRKPAPAPPPPRGRARSDSRGTAPAVADTAAGAPPAADEGPTRTSSDSVASRSDPQPHKTQAPAPPPPRRPHLHQPMSSMTPSSISDSASPASVAPPVSQTANSETEAVPAPSHNENHAESHDLKAHSAGAAPPPPPPARHGSTRRAGSAAKRPAADSRKESHAHHSSPPSSAVPLPPPPPPPRARGSSKGSMDRPTGSPELEKAATADAGKGTDILADLEALQREVDAMRGKLQ